MSNCSCNCGGHDYVNAFRGPAGPRGAAATIEIGKVVSGTEAKVTNSGTSTNAVLDFTLPVSTASAYQYGVTAKVTDGNVLSTFLRVSQDGGSSWQDTASTGSLAMTIGEGLTLSTMETSGVTQKVTLSVDPEKMTGLVRTVNGTKPDDAGEVTLKLVQMTDDASSTAEAVELTAMSPKAIHELFDSRKPYEYTQSTEATTWTINHNLGRMPVVLLVDDNGDQLYAQVHYSSVNTVVVTFTSPTKGKAYLS